MKELKEYRDEVFRRSEQKKQQIKKRRRIALGVAVPLCLCAVLVVSIRDIPSGRKGDTAMEVADHVLNENGSQEMPAKVLRVTDPTEADRVRAILEGTEQEITSSMNRFEMNQDLADQAQTEHYRLTLFCSDGSTVFYRVQGQEVYCETSGKYYRLSGPEVQSLCTLLTEVAEAE